MFGCQTYDLKPDMITMAKALSSAYLPISALMISEEIFQVLVSQSEKIGTFGHGFTYGGHPVPAAVALETLKIYEEMDILSHVRRVAPYMQAKIGAFADHPLVGEVRGVGLLGGIELVRDKETKESFDPALAVGLGVANACEADGVIVRAIGDTIAMSPPLIVEERHLDDIIGVVGKVLDATHAALKADGKI